MTACNGASLQVMDADGSGKKPPPAAYVLLRALKEISNPAAVTYKSSEMVYRQERRRK